MFLSAVSNAGKRSKKSTRSVSSRVPSWFLFQKYRKYRRRRKRPLSIVKKRIPFAIDLTSNKVSCINLHTLWSRDDSYIRCLHIIICEYALIGRLELRAFLIALRRQLKRQLRPFRFRRYVRAFSYTTRKVRGSRMGKGKGHNIVVFYPVRPGTLLCSIYVLTKNLSVLRQFLNGVLQKLGVKTSIHLLAKHAFNFPLLLSSCSSGTIFHSYPDIVIFPTKRLGYVLIVTTSTIYDSAIDESTVCPFNCFLFSFRCLVIL